MTDQNLNLLPLEDLHQEAGARFGGFAGWRMPLTYPAGVMQEHLHTRAHAGLFDISHMKMIEVAGPGAAALLARACPIEPEALALSQSKLSFLLNEEAGILDDLIVTRLGEARFMVVANAGNAVADIAHLNALAGEFECTVTPLERVFLAIQGPEAADVMAKAGFETDALTFMHGIEPQTNWFMSRSGYTGEDGFEIGLPVEEARAFAQKLLSDNRVMWIGLAARDSLRLEAGLCLHGNDISPDTSPAAAALMWAIPKDLRENGQFIGADALRAVLAKGADEKRVGLKAEGRLPVRGGANLVDADGNPAGRVTSGGFGPSADHPVAMGYVATQLAKAGTKLFAEVRGNRIPIEVHPLPFTPHHYRKG
ncbi:glycine cleavage system aminomethyltransferase GcvT [Mesorhizobium sp. NBSH29]|uniref:glycine cleavage system aminomethyltransferase GcvT n=1 Tax=Mesorhizobium sp. NBSH29 TaxID=2654249 RepID=UPI0018969EA0|nr:glycine cleavage system aminomethyltransferase GcvT [Mesorhizobium sp. NBSH29]QPC87606.1 glycine cleavage system aminomethyltransferase GcvT [Mesorhizobium sp. NBSH29]